MNRAIRTLTLGTIVSLCALAASADSPLPNWKNFADIETIQVVTADDDEAHTPRDTTIWLAVYQDQGYIRTGGTTWGDNARRDPNLVIRMNDAEYALHATAIQEGELYDAVAQAFRDKYGFEDAAMSVIRAIGGTPTIMRLDGRPGIPMGN